MFVHMDQHYVCHYKVKVKANHEGRSVLCWRWNKWQLACDWRHSFKYHVILDQNLMPSVCSLTLLWSLNLCPGQSKLGADFGHGML